jgi:hypothetical protein
MYFSPTAYGYGTSLFPTSEKNAVILSPVIIMNGIFSKGHNTTIKY